MQMISKMTVRQIGDILARRGSSSSTTGTSDGDLAFSLFAEEAKSPLNVAKDHHVDSAVNEGLPDELVEIEETAYYDHLMAVALSEGRAPPPKPQILDRIRSERKFIAFCLHCQCYGCIAFFGRLQQTLASSSGQRSIAPTLEPHISRGCRHASLRN